MLLIQDSQCPIPSQTWDPKSVRSLQEETTREHGVDYIDLPVLVERRESVEGTDMGEYLRVDFEDDTMGGIAGRNRPHVPNVSELRLGMIKYFQENKPELLECKVERSLHDRGHEVLWTPPYCPDLQPIELFWAAGRNHAACGCTLREPK